MTINYCHNCKHHLHLPDTVHCEWCLNFFYSRGRMPRPGDTMPEQASSLQALYATMGWNQ